VALYALLQRELSGARALSVSSTRSSSRSPRRSLKRRATSLPSLGGVSISSAIPGAPFTAHPPSSRVSRSTSSSSRSVRCPNSAVRNAVSWGAQRVSCGVGAAIPHPAAPPLPDSPRGCSRRDTRRTTWARARTQRAAVWGGGGAGGAHSRTHALSTSSPAARRVFVTPAATKEECGVTRPTRVCQGARFPPLLYSLRFPDDFVRQPGIALTVRASGAPVERPKCGAAQKCSAVLQRWKRCKRLSLPSPPTLRPRPPSSRASARVGGSRWTRCVSLQCGP